MNNSPHDLTVLIDAPPLPRRRGEPRGSHAAGLTATLDWAHARGLVQDPAQPGRPALVVLRDGDPEAQEAAREHPCRPDLIALAPHQPGTDPDGVVTTALQRPYTLALHPGVTPNAHGDTLERALQHLDAHPDTACVTGQVVRSDGAFEAHPMTSSLHGGATLFRTETLHRAGGLSRLLTPGGAADLDLTCRLMRCGQHARRYDDLLFDRAAWPAPAAPTGRQLAAALRDALIVTERYFPRPVRRAWRRDTTRRAADLYANLGLRHEFALALQTARRTAQWEHRRGRSTLHADQLETLLGWKRTKHAVRDWASREHPRRVVLAGWHPNLYAAYRAAKHAGLTVTAVADDTPAAKGSNYHGTPVLPLRDALTGATEGVILTDTHPASTHHTAHAVAQRFQGPTLSLHTTQHIGDTRRTERPERPAPRLAA